MLKRWIFCILLICLLFSIAGCGAQKEAAGNNIDGNYYLTEDLDFLVAMKTIFFHATHSRSVVIVVSTI